MNRLIAINLLFIVLLTQTSCTNNKNIKETVHVQFLHKGWKFKKANDENWLSATVPGCVHTDLLNHKKIEDPFYRLNEQKVQWIGKTDWVYSTSFDVENAVFEQPEVNLVFDGLDTYADIYLNDSLILSADNMFRQWKIPVKGLLKKKNNHLKVYFNNVFKVNMPKWEKAPFRLFAYPNNDQADIKINMYSRKAAYEFGWDWGPRLITSGIWRPVYLEAWNDFKINDIYYRQDSVTKEIARITTLIDIESDIQNNVTIEIKDNEKTITKADVALKPGLNSISIPFEIKNPKLWWTNGLGKQYLYDFQCVVSDEKGHVSTDEKKIGIRSLKIIAATDKFGKSFYVELNGVPVFMKGANYIPQDNFLNRVTKEKYEFIISSAAKANMNMLRVWGGGIYENDIFYDLCDKYGILVWQDMMFACAMYPSDKNFTENVSKEITYNIKRLRNHPSIALYCGNNELEIAWYAWGMKNEYPDSIQKVYEKNYNNLFHKIIPEAIRKVDPKRYYIPSSPMAGMPGRPVTTGDSHYWGVWHGKEPFSNFKNNVARFMSEYGFQSYPEFSSIKKFTKPQDWFLNSDVMHAHQRCMADDRRDKDYGNRLIDTYLKRNFKEPKDFEKYLYVVQALQAKGVTMAIEAHRRHKTDNYCMGSLYWQIDDCWPVASWSGIDYYGKWKALHYYVKNAYSNLLISHTLKNKILSTYIVSDELNALNDVIISVNLYDLGGKLLWHKDKTIKIDANTSKVYLKDNLSDIIDSYDKRNIFLYTTLKTKEGELLTDKKYYFVEEKDLLLQKPVFDMNISKTDNGFDVKISSNTLARYVFITLKNDDKAIFSDNYFDLIPNKTKNITVKTKSNNNIKEFKDNMKIISLYDSY